MDILFPLSVVGKFKVTQVLLYKQTTIIFYFVSKYKECIYTLTLTKVEISVCQLSSQPNGILLAERNNN